MLNNPILADADWVIFYVVAGFVGLAIAGIAIGAAAQKKRREAMKRLADEWAFHFQEKMEGLGEADFAGLRLFTLGRAKAGRNLIYRHEEHGSELLFDYTYRTGGGKNAHTHHQTVVAVTLGATLPAFELRPEHFFHKIGGMLGMQDINIHSRPVFSSKFLLRASDESSVREFFSDPVCDLLEQNPRLSVEGAGHYFIVYHAGRRQKPQDMAAFLDTARRIRDTFVSAARVHHRAMA